VLASLKQQAGIRPYASLRSLSRQGKEYRALCPFHDDKRAGSFTIYPGHSGEYVFKCHSCGKAGDVVDIVMKTQNLPFLEAVRMIAKDINLKLPDPATERHPVLDKDYDNYGYDLSTSQQLLRETPEAIDYLVSRGISLDRALEKGLGLIRLWNNELYIVIPYGEVNGKLTAKLRALRPEVTPKWTHFVGTSTSGLLYNLDSLDTLKSAIITESELDTLTLESLGYNAVSVSSAKAVVGRDGLTIREDQLAKISDLDVYLAVDQDDAGQSCAKAFLEVLRDDKTFLVSWDYDNRAPKSRRGPKDIGDLFALWGSDFKTKFDELLTRSKVPTWRREFKTPSQMDDAPLREIISGILPELGMTSIAGLSNHGKTLFAIEMVKALLSGRPFLGHFEVLQPSQVLYLCPEVSERSFRYRLGKFGLGNCGEELLCQTLSDGQAANLRSPSILRAARDHVVFLDTAIRFADGDENNSRDNNKGLAESCFSLLRAGAKAVVCLHHSAKAFSREEQAMTLENTHRGSGDFGAMATMSYAVVRTNADTTRLHVECVKHRDTDTVPVKPFEIEGRPWIDQEGGFRMVAKPGEAKPYFQIAKERKATIRGEVKLTGADKVRADSRYAVVCRRFDSGKSDREISRDIGIRPQTVADMRKAWEQDKAGGLLDGLELESVQ
jgi:hypothetical protein